MTKANKELDLLVLIRMSMAIAAMWFSLELEKKQGFS
jgi:hypothetical protein